MTRFHLEANNEFIDGEGDQLNVWRVDYCNMINETGVFSTIHGWKRVTILDPNKDELEIFGRVITGYQLNQLAQEIKTRSWAVNREGYIYMYVYVPGRGSMSFRINDFFCWSKYDVHPTRSTVWNKLEMDTQNMVVDLNEKDHLLEEDERKLHEMAKELSSCKDQLAEKDKSLTEYQQKMSDFEKQLNEKEKELLDLKARFAGEEERLEAVEKELSFDEENLKKKIKKLSDVQTELSSYKEYLDEKEKELSKVEFRLAEREEEINLMEKELSGALKKIEEKKLEMKYLVSFFIILIFALLIWAK